MQAAEFAQRFPAWTGADGFPRSWKHFVVGMRYLARDSVLRVLDTATAVRAANATGDDYHDWRAQLSDRVM